MSDLFATGRIADFIIAFTVCEALILIAYFRASGRGIAAANLLPNLGAGACLMLALRGALMSASWPTIAAPLAAAFVFHVTDLYRRWHSHE